MDSKALVTAKPNLRNRRVPNLRHRPRLLWLTLQGSHTLFFTEQILIVNFCLRIFEPTIFSFDYLSVQYK